MREIKPLLTSAFCLATGIVQHIYDGIQSVISNSDNDKRFQHATKFVEYLDYFGGFGISTNYLRGEYQGNKDTELQISINYLVHHSQREEPIEQHKTFCLDFSSWKILERDIKTLATIFHEIYGQSKGIDEEESKYF